MANDAKKSPAAKGAATAKAAKPAKPAPAAKSVLVAPPAPPEGAKGSVMLKVKDLVDRVAEATDGKRSEIKKAVEATLAELGKALEAGEVLNLPPIGKIKVAKSASDDNGGRMTVKVRKSTAKPEAKSKAKEALAEAEDNS